MDNSSLDVAHDRFNEDINHMIWIASVIGLIALLAVVGNILVMIAFFQDPKIQRNVSNLFILSMSISDCIVGLISLPIYICERLLDHWPFGKRVCQIWLALDYSISLISIHMITMISLDRYWLVTKKLKYKEFQTRRQVKVMICTSWVMIFLFYTGTAFLWEPFVAGESVIDYTVECDLEALYNGKFSTSMLFVEFIIPLLIIVTFNAIVYHNIRIRSRRLVKNKKSRRYEPDKFSNIKTEDTNTISSVSTNIEMPSVPTSTQTTITEESQKQKQSEFQRHRKAAITLAVIVGVFLCCLTPYYVVSILFAFCEDCIPDKSWDIANCILWCNAALNPFLYAVTIVQVRRNFLKSLGLGRLMNHSEGQNTTLT